MDTPIHIHTRTGVHTYSYTHSHTYTCTYTHTLIHTLRRGGGSAGVGGAIRGDAGEQT